MRRLRLFHSVQGQDITERKRGLASGMDDHLAQPRQPAARREMLADAALPLRRGASGAAESGARVQARVRQVR